MFYFENGYSKPTIPQSFSKSSVVSALGSVRLLLYFLNVNSASLFNSGFLTYSFCSPPVDVDYARLIWTTLQVALFLAMGVITMFKAYNFVVDEFRGRIVKKIDNLQKFDNYISALPVEEPKPVEKQEEQKDEQEEKQEIEGGKE